MIRRLLRWLGPLIPHNSRGSQPRIPANPKPPPPVQR